MRALIIADCHVGNLEPFGGKPEGGLNERCRQTLAALRRAIEEGKRRGCTHGISAGDLLDSATAWPQIIAATREVLSETGWWWYLLRGNHEVRSASARDDSLCALRDSRVYALAPSDFSDPRGPIFAASFDFDWSSVEERSITSPLVVAHVGLAGDDTPAYLNNGIYVRDIASKCSERTIIVSGDWHPHRHFAKAGFPNVFQIGALAAKNFSELGADDYGWAGVYDSEKGSYEPFRVPGPRFHVFESIGHARLAGALRQGIGEPSYLRVLYGEGEDPEAVFAELAAKLPPNTFQVLPAPRETKVVDTSKAAVATSAEQAVDRYVVERLKLPAGIDPAEFAAEAKRRLSNGRR